MTSLDIYHIPREQVDVEGLAQEFARYLRLNAIDVVMLAEHPQERDALIAATALTGRLTAPADLIGA